MDISHPNSFLQQEEHRLATFSGHEIFPIDIRKLAEAGFYSTDAGNNVRCFDCNLEVDVKSLAVSDDIVKIHRTMNPHCSFACKLATRVYRNMTFVSYDSLRYEEQRLGTFIDWPHEWLKPSELAADGFYHLRKRDYCACIFCRGIVGAWERGDTPRGEHQRHFPHCPFIRDQPVGNVPIIPGNILARLPALHVSLDDCRSSRRVKADVCGLSSRHMAGSYPECRGSLEGIGLSQHSGPTRSDFMTVDSRLETYVEWPEDIGLHIQDLAEAGFFYCGLSDHVRCFHCGKGLRNWISSDIPWKEHARWYPTCRFVLLMKGQDYINKVQQEYPPYTRIASTIYSGIDKAASGSKLDLLMSLDIAKGVLRLGFPSYIVRATLKDRVEQTGEPYIGIEPCLEDVIQRMNETENQVADNRSESTACEPSSGETDISSSISEQQTFVFPSTSGTMENRVANIQSLPSESTEVELLSQQQVSILPSTSEIRRQQASVFPSTSEMIRQQAILPTAPLTTTLSSSSSSSERENTETETKHILQIVEEFISQTSEEEEEEYEEKKEFKSKQSYEQLKEELERMRENRTCKVCMDSEITVVFLPCAHMVTCASCAVSLRQCPICRSDIRYA
ncbi:LOW QUALITY PROTEIN: baculoviral IAP repeat-containing protein 7-like, partial [Penaeus indicus]|uniref:LOW QUALITY PROTEIN: baculoviral IAP repeat-containing protein 7-like n=1 Tax=Penaeus indicus TaxID=29960 RepID=UPI00300C00A1